MPGQCLDLANLRTGNCMLTARVLSGQKSGLHMGHCMLILYTLGFYIDIKLPHITQLLLHCTISYYVMLYNVSIITGT